MKKVLILSINPKWTELILSGKKTVEIRKQPIPVGTLVMMYETKNGGGKGKIVGSFVVSNCQEIKYPISSESNNEIARLSCLYRSDMLEYTKNQTVKTYGIFISQLKVFEKELSEFCTLKEMHNNFNTTRKGIIIDGVHLFSYKEITKPPQSKTWAYMDGKLK